MPTSLLNLKVARDRRGERPRNPDVEQAWSDYSVAFARWAQLCDASIHSDHDGYYAAQLAREKALISLKKKRDEALMHYFLVYDQDQREAFG